MPHKLSTGHYFLTARDHPIFKKRPTGEDEHKVLMSHPEIAALSDEEHNEIARETGHRLREETGHDHVHFEWRGDRIGGILLSNRQDEEPRAPLDFSNPAFVQGLAMMGPRAPRDTKRTYARVCLGEVLNILGHPKLKTKPPRVYSELADDQTLPPDPPKHPDVVRARRQALLAEGKDPNTPEEPKIHAHAALIASGVDHEMIMPACRPRDKKS